MCTPHATAEADAVIITKEAVTMSMATANAAADIVTATNN